MITREIVHLTCRGLFPPDFVDSHKSSSVLQTLLNILELRFSPPVMAFPRPNALIF